MTNQNASSGISMSVEPTYLSTDLITPGKKQRSTLPSIAFFRYHSGKSVGNLPWGNKATDSAQGAIQDTNFKHLTKYEDYPTHRHFGTKVIQPNSADQPYEETQLQLSECRLNDQRLPPVNNDLILKSKISLPKSLRNIEPYFSHKSKFGVFPSTEHDKTLEEKFTKRNTFAHGKSQVSHGSAIKSTEISQNTLEALKDVNKNIYSTTTYMNSYQDPKCVKKSNMKLKTSKNTDKKRVSFDEHIICYENEAMNVEYGLLAKLDSKEKSEDDLTANGKEADVQEYGSDDEICCLCRKPKKKTVELRYLNESGKVSKDIFAALQNKGPVDSASRSDAGIDANGWPTWPVGNHNLENGNKNRSKNIIPGYNNRPKCSKRFLDVCDCERFPQLKDSVLKAEFISKRRAATFARRNYTAISVFSLLKHKGPGAIVKPSVHKKKSLNDRQLKKEPRFLERSLNSKTEGHKRCNGIFPDRILDLRDAKRTVRKVIFNGYHSQVFR